MNARTFEKKTITICFVLPQRLNEGYGGSEDGQLPEQEVEEPCYGKRCTANEHCCPGSVCVDVDGGKNPDFTIIRFQVKISVSNQNI